jgi:P27 family predicted phage terminase small subunit
MATRILKTRRNLKLTIRKSDDAKFSTAPPAHLSKESAAFFKRTVALFDLEEHHLKLLTLACEAWDRSVQSRKLIETDGLTFVDRHGSIKPHAAVAIEKDSRIAFARLVREIGMDVAGSDSRPPALPANRG